MQFHRRTAASALSELAFLALMLVAFTAQPAERREFFPGFEGVKYDETGRPVGMPMGGVGAGAIEINSQGALAEFGNLNNWVARIPSIPGSGLWLTYTVDGKTQAFPLAGGRVRFEGNFPFAKLTFPDLPAELTLWCWSPLVLHDLRHSAYPGALFDAEIKNPGSKTAEVGLVLCYGTDYSQWLREIATSHVDMGATAGFDEWGALRSSAMSHAVNVSISSRGWSVAGKRASGINFTTQAWVDDSAVARIKADRAEIENIYLRNYDFTPVDIRAACNRSYVRAPFDDDGLRNFPDLKPGPREVDNIPFVIIDDQASGGKSLVMAGPRSTVSNVIMPVNVRADCLFFLGNVAGWAADGSAEYVIHYADGSSTRTPLRIALELSEFWGGAVKNSPAKITGQTSLGPAYQIHVYGLLTDPSKIIQSVEVRKTGNTSPMVFALTVGRAVTQPLAEGIRATRQTDIDRMAGNPDAIKLASNTDASYALVARKTPGSRVINYTMPDANSVRVLLESGESTIRANAAVYAIEQRVRLKPGQSGRASLICAWHAPNHRNLEGHLYGHRYQDWFANAGEVADELARDHDALLEKTVLHYDLIAKSTLPKWLRELLQSNHYLGPVGTWLTRDGISFTYESPDRCPALGTLDVRYYGLFQKLAAFPELDTQELRELGESQKGDGFVPHDLGVGRGLADIYLFPQKEPPVPPKEKHSYDGYWVNLPIKFCLEVALNYQWTGNREFLQEMWPRVKRAVAWVRNMDEDNDGLPETSYGYDGWSMSGKSGYDANQWIAMLVAVARLADDLGEPQYAAELRAVHKKALAQTERLLWTGKYFRVTSTTTGGKNDDMVSALQVAGDWYGDVMGFETGIPKAQVRSALHTIDDVLGKDAQHGVTVCLYPDGSNNGVWQCYIVGTGWSLFYASHCIYEGLDDIGLRIADEIWTQYMVKKARVPWRQEEAIEDPHTSSVTDRLLRDMRLGVAMNLSHATAGLQLDLPKRIAAIKPAEWVWKDGNFILPILLPKWLGQVKYTRTAGEEIYKITNLDKPVSLDSLKLRTAFSGTVRVTLRGKTIRRDVGADGMVDIDGIVIDGKPIIVRITTI